MIVFSQKYVKVSVKDGAKLLKQQVFFSFFWELILRCYKLGLLQLSITKVWTVVFLLEEYFPLSWNNLPRIPMCPYFSKSYHKVLESRDGCADSCGVDSSLLLIIAWLSSAKGHHTKYLFYLDKSDNVETSNYFLPCSKWSADTRKKSKPS